MKALRLSHGPVDQFEARRRRLRFTDAVRDSLMPSGGALAAAGNAFAHQRRFVTQALQLRPPHLHSPLHHPDDM